MSEVQPEREGLRTLEVYRVSDSVRNIPTGPGRVSQDRFNTREREVIGSYATVASQLDALASTEGLKGIMCIFDDFVAGTEDFGRHVMPLLCCR